jgi:hypothetical protein
VVPVGPPAEDVEAEVDLGGGAFDESHEAVRHFSEPRPLKPGSTPVVRCSSWAFPGPMSHLHSARCARCDDPRLPPGARPRLGRGPRHRVAPRRRLRRRPQRPRVPVPDGRGAAGRRGRARRVAGAPRAPRSDASTPWIFGPPRGRPARPTRCPSTRTRRGRAPSPPGPPA